MTHTEFCEAYAAGKLEIEIDRAAAARFVSGRLLLPLVLLPLFGIGVGLALTGWIVTGFALIALGIAMRAAIRRGAPRFVLTQALADESFYRDAVSIEVLRAGRRDRP